jgi:Nup85 Nucleoporin
MNGVLPIDQKATLEVFRSVRNPQNIQQAQMTDDLKTFWSSIYALVLEGKLMGAWEILSLHGDLASIITSTDMNNDSDRDTLEAIYDVLSTHPYIDLVDSLAKNNPDEETTEISPTMALEFKDWQEKVSSILQRQPPLLGRVSELNTLLYLLIGDKDTLIAQAGGEWTSLGVGLFLYVHPPPLIRANISKIVKSAMSMVLPRSNISDEDRAK